MPDFKDFLVCELLNHITGILLLRRLLVRGLVLTRDDWHAGHGFLNISRIWNSRQALCMWSSALLCKYGLQLLLPPHLRASPRLYNRATFSCQLIILLLEESNYSVYTQKRIVQANKCKKPYLKSFYEEKRPMNKVSSLTYASCKQKGKGSFLKVSFRPAKNWLPDSKSLSIHCSFSIPSAGQTEAGSNLSTKSCVSSATVKHTVSRRQEMRVSWWTNCISLNTCCTDRARTTEETELFHYGKRNKSKQTKNNHPYHSETFHGEIPNFVLETAFNNPPLFVKCIKICRRKVLNLSEILLFSPLLLFASYTSETNMKDQSRIILYRFRLTSEKQRGISAKSIIFSSVSHNADFS